jgi:prepilin signal peptidase PulO-like enzyme (type II secretory pathway)
MEILNSIFFFCLGAVSASFLNLCVFRLENSYPIKGIIFGKSFCENCKKELNWLELIPVFSFVFLRGKCLKCKSKINIFYFFSEVLLGLIFFSFYYYSLPIQFFVFLVPLYFWAAYDFHYQNIPKKITDFILLLSFFYWFALLILDFDVYRIYTVIIALAFSGIFLLLSLKKTLFGLGDILVFIVLAFWLELNLFLSTLLFSFFVGGVFSILLVLKDKAFLKKYIPFLPFVFLGYIFALLSYYSGLKLFELVLALC